MTQLEKIEAMVTYLLNGAMLSDDEIIDIWNQYTICDCEPHKTIYCMDEFDEYFKGCSPLEIVTINTTCFNSMHEWFTYDVFFRKLYSYDSIGEAIDSVIDWEVLAEYIIDHPNEHWNTDIECKLIELDEG